MAENKWVTGGITLLIGVITAFITGGMAHLVDKFSESSKACCDMFTYEVAPLPVIHRGIIL